MTSDQHKRAQADYYAAELRKANDIITALRACLAEAEARTPDYIYDPANWDCTYEWHDRDLLVEHEPHEHGRILGHATLIIGPPKFAAYVSRLDDAGDEIGAWEWFDSEDGAKTALAAPIAAPPVEGA